MSVDRDAPALPWWAARRARMIVLLACLSGAVVGAARQPDQSAGRASASAPARAPRRPATWCVPPGLPEVARADVGELLELRAGVSAAAPRRPSLRRGHRTPGRRLVRRRTADPARHPAPPAGAGRRATRCAGGRPTTTPSPTSSCSPGPRPARKFFDLAASRRCHRDGAPRATALPPAARELAWTNPDDAAQEDVFLLRGRRVYRVAAVRLRADPLGRPSRRLRIRRRDGLRAPGRGLRALGCSALISRCRPSRSDQVRFGQARTHAAARRRACWR